MRDNLGNFLAVEEEQTIVPPATSRNMPSSLYGVTPVSSYRWDEQEQAGRTVSVWYTMADLLGQGMEPRPFYSERRRMDKLPPVRLGLYLILRALYYRLPDSRVTRFLWRHYRG